MKQHKTLLIVVLVPILVLTTFLALPATASASGSDVPYVTYVAKHGDWLAKIARQYCTTWQEIYSLNRSAIGPYPDKLVPGTVLKVPNGCDGGGSTPDGAGVYDRGPREHARGTVTGNTYTVAYGDTIYSISKRFGVSQQALMQANPIKNPSRIYAGQKLAIPGLVPPKPPKPTPVPSFITITSPAAGSVLPATFTVSGTGGGLVEGNVVVKAQASNGTVLAEEPTTLQGPDVGTGGTGTWSVQLAVNAAPGTMGSIVAFSPETSASATVPVTFGSEPSPPTKDFAPGECQIVGRPGAPIYGAPGGQIVGQFVTGGSFAAIQSMITNGRYWYSFESDPGSGNPVQWVPTDSIEAVSSGCIW